MSEIINEKRRNALNGLPKLALKNSALENLCNSCAARASKCPSALNRFALRAKVVGPCVSGTRSTKGVTAMTMNQ